MRFSKRENFSHFCIFKVAIGLRVTNGERQENNAAVPEIPEIPAIDEKNAQFRLRQDAGGPGLETIENRDREANPADDTGEEVGPEVVQDQGGDRNQGDYDSAVAWGRVGVLPPPV